MPYQFYQAARFCSFYHINSPDFGSLILFLVNHFYVRSGHRLSGAELGISESVLYRWVRDLSPVDNSRQSGSYAALEAENRRLHRENDFLKKASRYFASQPT